MISSASALNIICEKKAATALGNFTEESLSFQSNRFRNRIDFAIDIMKEKLRQIGAQHLRDITKKWKNKGAFDILNDTSQTFTLVHLIENPGNMNHDISIIGYWIFESNY